MNKIAKTDCLPKNTLDTLRECIREAYPSYNVNQHVDTFVKLASQPESALRFIQQVENNPLRGLSSQQIAERSRRAMFGDNHEAFPSNDEWSRWAN